MLNNNPKKLLTKDKFKLVNMLMSVQYLKIIDCGFGPFKTLSEIYYCHILDTYFFTNPHRLCSCTE